MVAGISHGMVELAGDHDHLFVQWFEIDTVHRGKLADMHGRFAAASFSQQAGRRLCSAVSSLA